jgi:hypothetical protein
MAGMKDRFVVANSCDNERGLYILDLENVEAGWENIYRSHGVDIIKFGIRFAAFFEDRIKHYKRVEDKIIVRCRDTEIEASGHHGSTWDPETQCYVITNSGDCSLNWYSNGEKIKSHIVEFDDGVSRDV